MEQHKNFQRAKSYYHTLSAWNGIFDVTQYPFIVHEAKQHQTSKVMNKKSKKDLRENIAAMR